MVIYLIFLSTVFPDVSSSALCADKRWVAFPAPWTIAWAFWRARTGRALGRGSRLVNEKKVRVMHLRFGTPCQPDCCLATSRTNVHVQRATAAQIVKLAGGRLVQLRPVGRFFDGCRGLVAEPQAVADLVVGRFPYTPAIAPLPSRVGYGFLRLFSCYASVPGSGDVWPEPKRLIVYTGENSTSRRPDRFRLSGSLA